MMDKLTEFFFDVQIARDLTFWVHFARFFLLFLCGMRVLIRLN
jgi:hypothetical protein